VLLMDKTIKRFALIVIIAFILNLIWEYSHASLYSSQMLADNYNLTLIRASIGDIVNIFLFFIIISVIVHKNLKWINKPKGLDYILLIVFGLILAIIIEYINLRIGRWAYTSYMPTILGIGVSPLVQLAVTSIVSLKIGLILSK